METGNMDYISTNSNNNLKISHERNVTPAVLGLSGSYGAKLSANMTPKDKQELLSKLEEWREARRRKMTDSILAKQKQLDKPKTSIPLVLPVRNRSSTINNQEKSVSIQKLNDKESVFERLFKNSGRVSSIKKPDGKNDSIKPPPIKSKLQRKSEFLNAGPSIKRQLIPNAKKEVGENLQIAVDKIIAQKIDEKMPFLQSKPESDEIRVNSQLQANFIAQNEIDSIEKNLLNEKNLENTSEESSAIDEVTFSKTISFEADDANIKEEIIVQNKKTPLCVESKEKSERVNSKEITQGEEFFSDTFEKNKMKTENLKVTELVDAEALKRNNQINQIGVIKQPLKPRLLSSKFMSSKILSKKSGMPKPKTTLRRSISMLYRKKCWEPEVAIHRAVSEENLQDLKLNNGEQIKGELGKNLSSTCKPQEEVQRAGLKSVCFATPKSINKSLPPAHLRDNLEKWLKINGHSLEGYRHLRCFGITNTAKALPRTPSSCSTYNVALQNPPSPIPADDSDKENTTPLQAAQTVDVTDVENWLKDLHRLIVELKYPAARCEEWLTLIQKNCSICTQLPLYWECLAALGESKGDVKSAIEYYERAIIKGAEVDAVGDSLAHLFDKMMIDQGKPSQTKVEKGLDPKNIFKSTVIKFALQQKAVKELGSKIGSEARQQLYIATPVRRSSRLLTPQNARVVNSLEALTPEIRSHMKFKLNESLLTGE